MASDKSLRKMLMGCTGFTDDEDLLTFKDAECQAGAQGSQYVSDSMNCSCQVNCVVNFENTKDPKNVPDIDSKNELMLNTLTSKPSKFEHNTELELDSSQFSQIDSMLKDA